MYGTQLLERRRGLPNPNWQPRRMPAAEEAAMMARLAISEGEAGIEDVRKQTRYELAPVIGEKAAELAVIIIVPPQAPETAPALEA